METIGQLIDNLITKGNEMWDNQEFLYQIRKMTFEQYSAEYFSTTEGAEKLWGILKKACDLNVERSRLIDAVDQAIVQMITEKK